jgi:repressor of nif and glnA expression
MLSRNCLCGVLLLLFLALVAWAEDPPKEPTAEQLKEAKDAFAKIGADYKAVTDPQTKRVTHSFKMPEKTQDADLKNLPNPPFAFRLALIGTQVTDTGLKELKDLKNLTGLRLANTKVTDVGLKELKGLKSLTELGLYGTQVTDVGLKELKDLKNLTVLRLTGTQVTDAGVKELQEALPNCEILR